MKVLVTGGAGYIGSFIVRALKEKGHEVVIVDDMSSGHKDVVEGFTIHEINLVTEKTKLDTLFKSEKFDGVIHMASFIQMGESFNNPLKYFENNLNCAINLLSVMRENNVKSIVFSSSAGVYGNPVKLPITEDDPKSPLNPYGESKRMIEKFLEWCDTAYNIKHVAIRYFNAAGASPDGSIGEDHPDESHLIPNIVKAALNGSPVILFGNDYDTPDGTNIRDYVHVMDLAENHILALEYLLNGGKSEAFNAGIGRGYSNKEVVDEVAKALGIKIDVAYSPRRSGDADSLYASIDKMKAILNWQPKYGLKEIVESAISWHKSHPEGYLK